MRLIDYLKEKCITLIFIIGAFTFAFTVFKLDNRPSLSQSNVDYILLGWLIFFLTYLIVDYRVLNNRFKKIEKYCQVRDISDHDQDVFYPFDREFLQQIYNYVEEFEGYKSDISNKFKEEQEFITKWLHDIKVPISGLKLILENHETELPKDFYKSMDTEILTIEESVQRIFYGMKTLSFYEDFKVTKAETQKIIANSLKCYSNLFSYKKLNISITGDNFEVLTDEKWSIYIVSQIISNAIKYTPDEGRVTINTSHENGRVTISIENSGQGIDSVDLAQVFKKGYTGSQGREGAKGTGYGLYLCKKLSDLLGHRLTVESNYGKSATFKLIFAQKKTLFSVTKM